MTYFAQNILEKKLEMIHYTEFGEYDLSWQPFQLLRL